MTEVLKLTAVGIICAVLCVLVRQYRPEIEPFVQISGIVVLSVMLFGYLKILIDSAAELFESSAVLNAAYLEVVVKVLVIAVITKIGADICTDSGNSALAENVELAGKVLMLVLCFPLIRTVAELAGGLLE